MHLLNRLISRFKLPRALGHMMLWVLSNIVCDNDPKIKDKSEKAGICDGVPSTAFLYDIAICRTHSQKKYFCTRVW